ncbi:protein of unknown function [Taphrina deformans PYCC 5710]|uniref:Midasin n=1 Tax=Taphrina deformans (strain PYCC 5710 / ATCC 11124 / CBS 356.35 / IMI 108563 / JCM 9778 / NBRC 8474) TaxID=1097556 RepID=R4XGM4_TAPDE|nr:protein of unknown function [Taphrina deformans PYCC 5710]|eukprot:CCG84812.1 protein of unknown function [Taphrina deformans PYCC 5710]
MERIAQQCLSSGNAAVLAAHRKQAALVFGYWATYYASAPELVTIAFARIIHAYPEARPFAISCLATDTLHLRSLTNTTDSALIEMLVAIWRLLRFSLKDFRHLLEARLLWPLLKHEHVAVRLLVANLLGLYLDMGDKLLSDTIDKIVATEASTIIVLEEGTSVDLRVFEVQEDIRIHNLRQTLVQAEQADHDPSTLPSNVVEIAGEYLPRVPHQSVAASQVVPTSVSTRNLSLLAKALRRSDFVLLQGLSGSGKTFLIEDLARSVGRDRDLVRIHLGDQTDAKLLLGTYITSATPGEFIWQSGVLANAVAQGKWILFEDIDKAPNDVLSILLPLLETRSIHIPSRGETIHAGPGLKVLATKATDGQAHWTPARLLGGRLWTPVVIEMAPNDELREVITAKYPLLRNMATTMMQTYEAVVELLAGKSGTTRVRRKGTSARPLGTLDLMKWCRRVQAVYMTNGIRSSDQTINQQVSDDIFSEAVDCFASSTSSTELKHLVVETIGRSLQVPPERVQFYLESHTPSFSDAATFLQVGRASLAKPNKVVKTRNRPFALTAHALRLLEQLIVAIRLKEPLLLVGETGTGKTTVIQQLATMMGHTLVAINMSQQTESGDLLGGFKPVDTRLIAIPLLEDFETLFSRTLSAHKNARFLAEIRKSFNKGQWSRLTALLTQSVKIARKSLTKSQNATDDVEQDLTSSRKKRKLDDDLFAAWDNFAANLDTFQAQHQRASKSFTFAFVEGALVKAVKRGDWVLLDEINLAATDTLESINGLLQEDGSILLSEKGDVQAIMPHPDFRIFSCMNPATDVGKRDLPAGIRSRFTELYIQSPDSSMPDLLAIIIKYIGGLCVEDSKACTDVAYLYTTTKQLASENKLVDGGNQCPHYSIRTLTRTLSYVLEISAIYGLRRSLYEGFCMSYLTLLNKESEAILKPIIEEYTILRVRNVKSSIAQIPRRPSDGEWVQFKHYWLPQGPLEPRDDPRYIMTPFVERNMLNLVRAATTKKYPILLQGPTSSGKTSMVEYLAKRTGHAFVRINNHENTDLQEYLGSYMSDDQGNLSFQEGILVEAIRKGHWLVLDELNLAPSDVLEALNRLLDDNRELLIPETQEVIKPHPSFVLFATQNPAGLYGGRKHLSRAFRNRFLELHFEDIPEDELETILCQRCQVAPTYCKRIVEVYKQLSIRRQSSRVFEQKNSFATLRDLFRWAMRPAVGYDELALNGYVLLAERVRRNEEKVIVQEVIEKVMKVSLTGVHDYAISDLTEYQIVVASGRDVQVVWTRAMRRLFILMALAFRNNEPVLLVGETGCGKTAVCQLIAEALNRPIQILNAHQNTETADMIGAQRPVRNRAQLSALLIADLLDFFRTHDPTKEYPTDLETLRTAFEALDFRILLDEQPQLEAKIVDLQHRLVQSKALFEWADGPLVQAMKEGQIFLMDEISLAEDAVLERLNSVLETGRSLVIAEKGAQDTGLTASPAYQFCATMNPGGDFGKKELSAALRNRFTEIWVPAMSDDTDMLQILAATLKSDRAHLGPIMINFARYFCQAFATALTSTVVSLRDLLAWARFCNQDVSDIRESFVQGAALVYIDALGATLHSADLDEVSTLRKQRQSCLAELTRLAGYECHQYYQTPYVLHSAPGVLAIGPYAITTGTTAAGPDIFELQAPTTFINATRVFRAMQLRKPILLEGSPGVGKTSLISAIAAMASKNLVRINFSDQTDLMDLFGSDTPVEDGGSLAFAWRDAPFLRAMQNGDWVLLDEMNLASQSILEGLNACLDHRGEAYIPELNRTFSCHPDFRIFAAQNPHSQGGGRKGLPKSFINRFTVVYCDPLNSSDIRHICYTKFSTLPTETVNNVIDLVFKIQHEANNRKNFAVAGGPWEFNLRDVFRWLSIIYRSDESAYASYYADAILRQRFRSLADRNSTDLCIEQIFGEAAAYRPAFALHTSEILGVGRTSTMRNASCTIADEYRPVLGAHRAAMEAILLCVDKAWPCILVGQSGSGKTVLLESIAQLLGHRLHTISINNDMDASDLLGGFEQRDATRHVAQVCKQIEQFCKDTIGHNLLSDSHEPLVDLICRIRTETQDEALLHTAHTVLSDFQPDTSAILSDLVKIQAEINQPSLGQFQWSDGSLVRAVTDGEWLVLDNANLCNPSVLDRLNSLLEPNGQLLVNERVMPDGQPMVVTPHPNFRLFLTMDPQNGELSRAMRNRGLEIFLMSGEAQTSFLPHTKSMSSTWSTAIHAADHSTEPSSDILRYLAECVGEHMPHDLGQCQFFGLTVSQNELFNIVLQVRKTLSQHFSLSPKSRVQSSESDVLCSVGSRVGTDAAILEFRALQLHFLCNELDAAWVHALKTLSTVLPKPALHDLSILVTVRTRICDYVVGQSSQALEGIDTLEIILTRLMFFVHACYTDTPLELLISVLRVVDRHIQSKLPSTVDLGLSRVLSTANYLVPLTSGACMERMWSALKPSSPVNRIAMDHYENLHALLQRLDESTILSRNSLPVIVQLKKRCLQTLNVVRHSSDIPGDTDPQAIASQLMPLTIESAHEEGASSSVFTSLFRHILHKVQLQQVSQFASWQDTEVVCAF